MSREFRSKTRAAVLHEDLAPAAERRWRHRGTANGALGHPCGAAFAAAEVHARRWCMGLWLVAAHDAVALLLSHVHRRAPVFGGGELNGGPLAELRHELIGDSSGKKGRAVLITPRHGITCIASASARTAFVSASRRA